MGFMRFMRLVFRLSISVFLLSFSLFIYSKYAFAETKAGINIATKYDELDDALSAITKNKTERGGWLYVMASPANQEFLQVAANKTQEYGVNLVIRGQCGYDPATKEYAQAWAKVLGSLQTNRKIYFMPWNEPNGPAKGDIIDPFKLNEYISFLIDAFDTVGIRQKSKKPVKVYLLSPMINQFSNILEYANQLRGLNNNFFGQFDGIAMNLYALYKNQTEPSLIDPNDSFRNSIGYPVVLDTLGVSHNTPVFGVESGVAVGGMRPLVRYNDAVDKLIDLYGSWVQRGASNKPFRHWQEDPNFEMFAIFSYSPDKESPDYNKHWLFEHPDLIDIMRSVRGDDTVETYLENIQSTSDFDQQRFQTAIASIPVDPSTFSICGGANSQLVSADYYDNGVRGQLYRVKVKALRWRTGNLNVRLTLGTDGHLRDPEIEWNTIAESFGQAREALKPVEFAQGAAKELPVPQLDQQIFAPVCDVRGVAGVEMMPIPSGTPPATSPPEDVAIDPDLAKRIKVHIDVSNAFYKDLPESYAKAASRVRFIQGAFVPGQELENKPLKYTKPPVPDPNVYSAILDSCSPDVFAYLDKAVDVNSGGNISFHSDAGFFGSLRGKIGDLFRRFAPNFLFRELYVYFQFRSPRALAGYHKKIGVDEKTGIASTFLPRGLTFTEHGETFAPIKVEGNAEVERVGEVSGVSSDVLAFSDESCPGKTCIPDPAQNITTRKEACMLDAFLPYKFKTGFCKTSPASRVSKEGCMDTSGTFRRLEAVVEKCNANVTFKWEPMPGATRYKVDIEPIDKNNNDSDWDPKPNDNNPGVWTSKTEMTRSMDYEGNAFDRYFWWRVLAMDACNQQVRASSSPTSSKAPSEHGYDGSDDDRSKIIISCRN